MSPFVTVTGLPFFITVTVLRSFSAIISCNSFGEWSFVSQSKDADYYVDFDRISKNNVYVYYWLLTNFPSPPYSKGKSSVELYEVNCNPPIKERRNAYYFYNSTTRKYVALFGTLFNQLKIQRHDNAGVLKKEMIVPSEHDSIFRKSLVHGYVHDEAASFMGGVSGNAGLFGNAESIGTLLNILEPQSTMFKLTTVQKFTSC